MIDVFYRWQVSEIGAVYKCVRFSRNFSLKDIKDRWHALLYDEHSAR